MKIKLILTLLILSHLLSSAQQTYTYSTNNTLTISQGITSASVKIIDSLAKDTHGTSKLGRNSVVSNSGVLKSSPQINLMSCTNGGSVKTASLNNGTQSAGIKVTDHANLDLMSALTLEAWIKPDSFGASPFRGSIISKEFWGNSNRSTGYVLRCGGNGVLEFVYGDSTANVWRTFTTNTGVLTTNTWQHVAVTFQQNVGVSLYINGVLQTLISASSFSTRIAVNNEDLGIGTGYYDANQRTFTGSLDEVRIWNVAKTQNEIMLNKDVEVCNTVGLVAYYRLNDLFSSTIADNSLSGVGNGTLTTTGSATILRQCEDKTLTAFNGTIAYVDSTATIGNTGESWANAYRSLGHALRAANTCPTISLIYVAKGTYSPTHNPFTMNSSKVGIEISSTNILDRTFHIRSGLEVIGGYPSGGGTYNPTLNKTILTGTGIGTATDTAYHVVFMDYHSNWGNANDTNKLIGCHIINGSAKGSGSITVNGATIERNNGGGYVNNSGRLLVSECIFDNNQAANNGGHIFSRGGRLTLHASILINGRAIDGGGSYNTGTNNTIASCVFYNNFASDEGGGIYTTGLNLPIRNCTFYGNNAINCGGGLFSDGTNITVSNNIFYKNLISGFSHFPKSDFYTVTTTSSSYFRNNSLQLTENNYTQLGGSSANHFDLGSGNTNYFALTPMFSNEFDLDGPDNIHRTSDDGLRLAVPSKLIDAGLDSEYPLAGVLYTDLRGTNRKQANFVEVGAYESLVSVCPSGAGDTILRVNNQLAFNGNGLTWSTAYNTLGDALIMAQGCPNIKEVWVKLGTHNPERTDQNLFYNVTDNKTRTFELRNGLRIYGGFAGGETSKNTRNPAANLTILDGRLANGEKVYHISRNNYNGITTSTLIDGFTLKNGNGGGVNNAGSAVYITGGGLTMNNCIVDSCGSSNSAIFQQDNCKSVFINSTFKNNNGGAIRSRISSRVEVYNCKFEDNIASNGAGIHSYAGSTYIENSIFKKNIGNTGASISGDNSFDTLIHCTIAGNIVTSNGTGWEATLFSTALKSLIMRNCIVQNNNAFNNRDLHFLGIFGPVSISNSKLDPNRINIPTAVTFSNNITDDVQFSDTIDYKVKDCSPAINAGIAWTMRGGNTDYFNNARVFGSKPDMGYYEHQTAHVVPTISTIPTICTQSMTTLTASTPQGQLWWYDGPTGGVGTNSPSFMTPKLLSTDTFYVGVVAPQCNSIRYPAIVPVVYNPAFPTSTFPVCLNLQGQLYANPVGSGFTYAWSGPSFSSSSQNPLITISTAGSYKYYVSVTTNTPISCSTVDSITVIAKPTRPIIYVDKNATGLNDGSSWTNAYTEVKTALDNTCNNGGEQLWVADGTYLPSSTNNRFESFNMKAKTSLFGGFNGGETSLNQRNITLYETILSGNIGNPSLQTDNSYRVIVNNQNGFDTTQIIDGFTISDGRADYYNPSNVGSSIEWGAGIWSNFTSLTVKNCYLKNNYANINGGGVACVHNRSTKFINTKFSDNSAGFSGGGLAFFYGPARVNIDSVYIFDCIFENNKAKLNPQVVNGTGGNAMWLTDYAGYRINNTKIYNNRTGSQPEILIRDQTQGEIANSLFYNVNSAIELESGTLALKNSTISRSNKGVTLKVDNQNAYIYNSILYGVTNPIVNAPNAEVKVFHSIVQGGYNQISSNNILNADPLFVDTLNNNFNLQPCSPALNSGLNSYNTYTLDISNNPRIIYGTIDLGVYEASHSPLINFNGVGYANMEAALNAAAISGGIINLAGPCTVTTKSFTKPSNVIINVLLGCTLKVIP
jgi:hypothetical protein